MSGQTLRGFMGHHIAKNDDCSQNSYEYQEVCFTVYMNWYVRWWIFSASLVVLPQNFETGFPSFSKLVFSGIRRARFSSS